MVVDSSTVERRNPRIRFDPVSGDKIFVHKCNCGDCTICDEQKRTNSIPRPINRKQRRSSRHEN